MNEREMLELAAKAAGYEYRPQNSAIVIDGIPGTWNPLENDGDALRLAVKLNIQVSFYRNHLSTTYYPDGSFYKRNCCIVGGNVDYGEDKYAATRLAITRAAAEIGRSTK